MSDTYTVNKNLDLPANNEYVNSWNVPVNSDFTLIDTALGGSVTINVVGGSGTIALTSSQYVPPNIELSGALTANVVYQFPASVGWFGTVLNATSGVFTVGLASYGGGTSVTLPQGQSAVIACDATNVRFADTLAAAPGGVSGDLQYNSGGVLAGAAGVTTDGSDMALTGNLSVTGNLSLAGEVTSGLAVGGEAYTPSVAVAFSATAMTVNCALSNVFATTLTANVTTAPSLSNAFDGQTINWFLTQDATGARTMTWPASFKWPGGVAGVLSTATNAIDLLVATYRSATGNWYASLLKGFA